MLHISLEHATSRPISLRAHKNHKRIVESTVHESATVSSEQFRHHCIGGSMGVGLTVGGDA